MCGIIYFFLNFISVVVEEYIFLKIFFSLLVTSVTSLPGSHELLIIFLIFFCNDEIVMVL